MERSGIPAQTGVKKRRADTLAVCQQQQQKRFRLGIPDYFFTFVRNGKEVPDLCLPSHWPFPVMVFYFYSYRGRQAVRLGIFPAR